MHNYSNYPFRWLRLYNHTQSTQSIKVKDFCFYQNTSTSQILEPSRHGLISSIDITVGLFLVIRLVWTCSALFRIVQTCLCSFSHVQTSSDLSIHVQTFSNFSRLIHAGSDLFRLVQSHSDLTCSDLLRLDLFRLAQTCSVHCSDFFYSFISVYASSDLPRLVQTRSDFCRLIQTCSDSFRHVGIREISLSLITCLTIFVVHVLHLINP